MGIAPDLARKILWRLLDGRDPAVIAAEVQCSWRAVAAVRASLDMVELASECAADGGRVVIEARDDAEAVAVKRLARAAEGFGGPKVRVEGPGAVRFARQAPVAPASAATPADDEQHTREERSGAARKASSTRGERGPVEPVVGATDPEVGVQPAAPQHQEEALVRSGSGGASSDSSSVKPEEAVSASAEATSAAHDAEVPAARPRAECGTAADDAGSGDSGRAGAAAPIASAAGSYNPAGGAAIGAGPRLPPGQAGSDRPREVGGGDVPGSLSPIASIPTTARGAEWASLYRGRRYDLGGLTPAQVGRSRSQRT